jgi:preprotein translocase subunit SecE
VSVLIKESIMAKQAQQTVQPGAFTRLKSYFEGVRLEMAKVTWPTREELKASTVVVMMFLALLAVIIGSLDQVMQRAVIFLFSVTS